MALYVYLFTETLCNWSPGELACVNKLIILYYMFVLVATGISVLSLWLSCVLKCISTEQVTCYLTV